MKLHKFFCTIGILSYIISSALSNLNETRHEMWRRGRKKSKWEKKKKKGVAALDNVFIFLFISTSLHLFYFSPFFLPSISPFLSAPLAATKLLLQLS